MEGREENNFGAGNTCAEKGNLDLQCRAGRPGGSREAGELGEGYRKSDGKMQRILNCFKICLNPGKRRARASFFLSQVIICSPNPEVKVALLKSSVWVNKTYAK